MHFSTLRYQSTCEIFAVVILEEKMASAQYEPEESLMIMSALFARLFLPSICLLVSEGFLVYKDPFRDLLTNSLEESVGCDQPLPSPSYSIPDIVQAVSFRQCSLPARRLALLCQNA